MTANSNANNANSEPILIYSPFGSYQNAHKTGQLAVKQKLAACVNLIPGLTSIYEWEGKVEEATEFLLLAKTIKRSEDKLIALIKQEHAYDEPAIVSLPISGGSESYLSWIAAQVTSR